MTRNMQVYARLRLITAEKNYSGAQLPKAEPIIMHLEIGGLDGHSIIIRIVRIATACTKAWLDNCLSSCL